MPVWMDHRVMCCAGAGRGVPPQSRYSDGHASPLEGGRALPPRWPPGLPARSRAQYRRGCCREWEASEDGPTGRSRSRGSQASAGSRAAQWRAWFTRGPSRGAPPRDVHRRGRPRQPGAKPPRRSHGAAGLGWRASSPGEVHSRGAGAHPRWGAVRIVDRGGSGKGGHHVQPGIQTAPRTGPGQHRAQLVPSKGNPQCRGAGAKDNERDDERHRLRPG